MLYEFSSITESFKLSLVANKAIDSMIRGPLSIYPDFLFKKCESGVKFLKSKLHRYFLFETKRAVLTTLFVSLTLTFQLFPYCCSELLPFTCIGLGLYHFAFG